MCSLDGYIMSAVRQPQIASVEIIAIRLLKDEKGSVCQVCWMFTFKYYIFCHYHSVP